MESRGALLDELAGTTEQVEAGLARVVVLAGEAGIGKTWLCEQVVARCRDRGWTVLATRGLQGEAELSYGVLFDVLSPFFNVITSLPVLRAAALKAALRLEAPTTAIDPLAVAAGCLELLSIVAAEDGPLCLIVDDVQWADQESVLALRFAARRLRADPVLVLFAVRSEQAGSAMDGFQSILVEGLDVNEAAKLIESERRVRPPTEVVRALVHATGGNPLALREATRVLTQDHLAGRALPTGLLPTPATIVQVYEQRLDRLSPGARAATLLLAADEAAPGEVLLTGLTALGLASSALREAEDARLITVTPGGARFEHPLMRSAAYQSASPSTRREAHRALAEAWERHGDLGRRAWHLGEAASGPDPVVAEALTAAARGDRVRGAHHAAAHGFLRAAEHEPGGQVRAGLLFEAALEMAASGTGDLLPVLDAVLAAGPAAEALSDVALLRARALTLRGRLAEAVQVASEAARRARQDNPRVAVDLLFEALYARSIQGRPGDAGAFAREALEIASASEPAVRAAALRGAAPLLLMAGEFEEGERYCRELLNLPGLSGRDLFMAAQFAVWLEEYERAAALVVRGIATSEARSSLSDIPTLLSVRAEVSLRTGHSLQAVAVAAEALDLADEFGQLPAAAFAASVLALAQAPTGQVDAQVVERLRRSEAAVRASALFLHGALGAAALARDDVDVAVGELAETDRTAQTFGVVEPNLVPWQADYVEALMRAGRRQEAERQLHRLERVAQRSRRQWALAAAARCRGVLARPDDINAAFAQAVELHMAGASPYERARTELAWGRRLVECGQATHARPHLSRALAEFDEIAATGWAGQTDELARRCGATPTRHRGPVLAELTAQEAQVAILVADGLTNREAAQRLFVSTKTVEFHLSRVYRKLGVRSRTQLARALA